MDVIGGVISRLDEPMPRWADRMRWWRMRRIDMARRVVDHLVNSGDVVLDIGAAQGHFSARMLDLVGARGRVHTFEPNPVHHARLRKLAASGPMTLHTVALSDHPGQATLHVPSSGGLVSAGLATLELRSGMEVTDVDVPVARLDEVIGAEVPVSFIKVDVEGHEDAAMRGGERLLTRHMPPVLVEIERRHRAEDVTVAFDHFAALGYEGWAVFPHGLRPLDAFDPQRDQLAFLGDRAAHIMPPEYVNDFLFAPPGAALDALLDRGYTRLVAA